MGKKIYAGWPGDPGEKLSGDEGKDSDRRLRRLTDPRLNQNRSSPRQGLDELFLAATEALHQLHSVFYMNVY